MSTPLVLRGTTAQVMLSMRPGPISREALGERFSSYPAVHIAKLVAANLVEQCRDQGRLAYRLTAHGKQQCPSRRDLYASADAAIKAQEDKEAGWHKSKGRGAE